MASLPLDVRLQPHNSHWSGGVYSDVDPSLRRLRQLLLSHEPELLARLPLHEPGIYTLVGGRQVGKSTLCKQAIARLLAEGVPPTRIVYVTCEPFRDAAELRQVLADVLAVITRNGEPSWLFVDEVTYVPDWDRTVKFLADAGALERCFLLLTGSDHIVIQDSLKHLPGRRGRAAQTDFHLRPLSFLEFVRLRKRVARDAVDAIAKAPLAELPATEPAVLQALEQELRHYHVTGGLLVAINDAERDGVVDASTMRIYADWIRGDVLRLDRSERFLREILRGVDRRYGSQITWNSLAKELSIDHPKTVADYVGILERMDAVLVVPAVAEHSRGPAPKTARKLFFADPFIHRAVLAWLGEPDAELASDARLQRDLEATFSGHVQRFTEGFYVKGMGEVDCAWYEGRTLQLLEVKWTTQLRPEELKEIRRRGRGVVACRTEQPRVVDGLVVLPAAVVLLRLAARAPVG